MSNERNAMMIDRGDVYVLRQPGCTNDDCDEAATHYVAVDVRQMGTSLPVGDGGYCLLHAEEVAAQIRLALPPESDV